jgi:hypothetical protein
LRIALTLIAVLLTTGAADAAQAVPPEPMPGITTAPAPQWVACRDRIHLVRQERGLPMLQRDTANPEEPLLIG